MAKVKMLTLQAWGDQTFDPPRTKYELRQMVKRGQIDPPPQFIGRAYFVQADAVVRNPEAKPITTSITDPVVAAILANR